jgi:hypothetical protein
VDRSRPLELNTGISKAPQASPTIGDVATADVYAFNMCEREVLAKGEYLLPCGATKREEADVGAVVEELAQ